MKNIKNIAILLPTEITKEIQELANEEKKTPSELVIKAFKQYKSQRGFKKLSEKAKKTVKKKHLTPKDFGGPFKV